MRTKPLVEGYLRWRDAGGKPGPRKGLAQGARRIAPRMTAADKRRRALAAIEQQEKAMAEREWWDNELIRSVIPGVLEYNRERAAALVGRGHAGSDAHAALRESLARTGLSAALEPGVVALNEWFSTHVYLKSAVR